MKKEDVIKDKNGTILKVGDIVHVRWDYDLIVCKNKHGWYGKLICEKGDSCENIPYALPAEDIELIKL